MVVERLLERRPYLKTVPEDAPNGLDSPLPPPPPIDWTGAGNVFPINGDKDDPEGGAGDQGDGTDESKTRREAESSWEDWALCIGAELMAELRAEVYKQLHYTCSAVSLLFPLGLSPWADCPQGIAHNKAMAKVRHTESREHCADMSPAMLRLEKAEQSDCAEDGCYTGFSPRYGLYRCELLVMVGRCPG